MTGAGREQQAGALPADGRRRAWRNAQATPHARWNGTPIAEAQVASLVDAEVTPRSPDGLTILTAHGQRRNSAGRIVMLPSRLMLVRHRADEGFETRIEAVRTAYKERFDQDSVMRIDGVSCVFF